MADKLTIERIFGNPSLNGRVLRDAQFSPGGSRITYLLGKDDAPNQLDLWEYHLADGKRSLLVDSRALVVSETLTDEELARRERQRIDASGIVEYHWAPGSDALLFPLGSRLFLYEMRAKTVRCLSREGLAPTDVRFSPKGRYVSFVHDHNLYTIDLRNAQERRLTFDGNGVVKNGIAEFVAQEEMQRFTGYWWAPDDSRLAFTRTDETKVEIARRFEVYADRLDVVEQRYPRAGTANACVQLGVLRIDELTPLGNVPVWVDLGSDEDIYLARVDWLDDSKRLIVQRQPRDQKRIDVLVALVDKGNTVELFCENDPCWTNLSNDLRLLKASERFLWSSERSGFRHIYLYEGLNGDSRQLTKGDWVVKEIVAVDEEKDVVYFTGFADTPLELHLYAVTFSGEMHRISREAGWHEISFSRDSTYYIDRFSSATSPSQVSLRRSDGQLLDYLEENRLDASHPLHPYVGDFVQPEFGTIAADDGTSLYYRMFKPKSTVKNAKHPAIVFVYGGPHAQLVTNAWQGDNGYWAQVLVEQGFVVFQLDNRGSFNRGKAFENHIYRRMGDTEVRDQRAGAEFLGSLSYVDAERIGIFGWSYGGYMTIMCLLKEPETFRAGVAVAPVSDWSLYDTHYTERYLGHPQIDGCAFAESSCLSYVDDLRGKLLLIHGMADDNVLFTHSTKMYQALQERGLAFEMMNYPGSKHSIWGDKVRRHLYTAMTSHFTTHL